MKDAPADVRAYLDALPEDRRSFVATVREAVLERLPAGLEETMQYGMISWVVPFTRLPNTYNGQPLAYASLASQKNYVSLYLMCAYGSDDEVAWLRAAFRQAGKKLDMGKSCVRFRRPDDVPLEVIAEAVGRSSVDEFVARYEATRAALPARPRKGRS